MRELIEALQHPRAMDEYLEVRKSSQVIEDIKMAMARGSERTLRDWFAGQALGGMCFHFFETTDLAAVCYRVADTMLVERQKEPTK